MSKKDEKKMKKVSKKAKKKELKAQQSAQGGSMRIIREIKFPKLKIPKINLDKMSNPENVDIDYAIDSQGRVKEIKDFKPYEATKYKTIKEVFIRSIDLYKDNPMILEKRERKGEFKTKTYGQMGHEVKSLGTALITYLNLTGEPIIIIGENCYGWYLSYMTLLVGGFIAVPVDKEIPDNELETLAVRSRAKAIVYTPRKKDSIEKLKNSVTGIQYFIQMYDDTPLTEKDVGLDSLTAIGERLMLSGDERFMAQEIDPEKFKLLIFTSGTTSASKGVMICNRNLAQNINAVSAYVKLYPEDRLFSVLPLHHTYESTIGFLVPFAWGCSVGVCSGLKYIMQDINTLHPSIILTVPLLVENIYKKIRSQIEKTHKSKLVTSLIFITNGLRSAKIDIRRRTFSEIINNLGGKMRLIISAAAPIDPNIGRWIDSIGITFLQGYGLTETAPIAALTPEKKPKIGTTGIPVICADIKLRDPNENGEGEIMIKSETLMLGYYEDEEATKEAITPDGWFHSGDMGIMDDEGFITITGRCKNVIVTANGKNIYPEEVEMVMCDSIPEIKECMVYGKEVEGEKELTVSMKVIPDYQKLEEKLDKKDVTPEEAYEYIWSAVKEANKTLSAYKAVKLVEIKTDDFEKTSTMKIKRYAEINKDKDQNEAKA